MNEYTFDEIIDRTGWNSVKYDKMTEYFGRNDILPLWVADMDFKTPDFILKELKSRMEKEILGYTSKPNDFEKVLKNWVEDQHNWEIKTEDIIYSPSVLVSIGIAILAYTQPGDKIVIQQPVYHMFKPPIENNDRSCLINQLKETNGKYTIDFHDLEKKFKEGAKMLIFCSPHNPVGRVWTHGELAQLVSLCQKYNVLIVSDEIHADLVFLPNKHTPLASISEEAEKLTITCLAPGKTFNMAGNNASVVVISAPELKQKFEKKLAGLSLQWGNLFSTNGFTAAYKYGKNWLIELLDYLKENIEFTENYIEKFIPKIKITPIEGTYLMWLNCKELNLNDSDLQTLMVEKAKVGLSPGIIFGKSGSGYMRLNIACPKQILQKALLQIKTAVNELI